MSEMSLCLWLMNDGIYIGGGKDVDEERWSTKFNTC